MKPETNYVKEAPQWEIETEKMIVPLLHLEIGLVNKAWVGFNNFLDEDVEQVTDEERELKENQCLLVITINELKEETEILSAEKSKNFKILKEKRKVLLQTRQIFSFIEGSLTIEQNRLLQSNINSMHKKIQVLVKHNSDIKTEIEEIENRMKPYKKKKKLHPTKSVYYVKKELAQK